MRDLLLLMIVRVEDSEWPQFGQGSDTFFGSIRYSDSFRTALHRLQAYCRLWAGFIEATSIPYL